MDPALWPFVAAGLGGVVIGLLLAIFGGGGSVLATPPLLYVVGVRDPHVAIGTAAAAVAVNAAMGLTLHHRAGTVKWSCALVFGAAGLIGALVGAHIAKQVEGGKLLLGFAVAMAAVGASMLLPKKDGGDPQVHLTRAMAVKLAPLGLGVGLAAGFFGIGGGFLIVPGLMAATGMTMANATASSLVSVVLFGAATSGSYALSGLVDWPVLACVVAGGAVGAVAGVPLGKAICARADLARRIFAVMVLATSAYVAWRALHPG
jgi:uncharacterized membrane protein YfcA